MTSSDLAHLALRVNSELLALGNERFEIEGATFVRNRAIPSVRDANHVTNVTALTTSEIDRLLDRVDVEFDGFPHRRFDLDSTTPTEFEARLAYDGYTRYDSLVMVLEGDLKGQSKPHDVRLVTSESDWHDLVALSRIANREAGWDELNRKPPEDAVREAKSKSPDVQWRLAFLDGEAVAHLCAWSGIDGVGQVEDLYTRSEYRHRGIATALIHRCVADARDHGAGNVVIVAKANDTPKRMYREMGFRPVAVSRSYEKQLVNHG